LYCIARPLAVPRVTEFRDRACVRQSKVIYQPMTPEARDAIKQSRT
jgi:hypothetical protein